MSMYVSVVRVTPEAFEQIKKTPDVLEAILMDADEKAMAKLGITEAHTAGFDYIVADEMMGAMDDDDEDDDGDPDDDDDDDKKKKADKDDDDDEEEDDAVYKDLGADGRIDYDAGYGNAFSLSPKAVKKAAKSSSVIELDDEVKELFQAAAKRGDYMIGVVS